MAPISHPYNAPHMTRTSFGNVKACCEKPEADHREWIEGEEVRITLKRDVHSGSHLLKKGWTVKAIRSASHGMAQVRPSRWGKNELGQFAEIDKGEYIDVRNPGWSIPLEERYSVGIPFNWAKEVLS